jgi:hypothetical protein
MEALKEFEAPTGDVWQDGNASSHASIQVLQMKNFLISKNFE